MAAFKARQLREVPLPPSPETHQKSSTRKGKLKGKEKESESVPCTAPRKRPPSHRKASLPWNWTTLTDPSASRAPPIFTKDGSYFFSLVGSSIRIYSVATGQIVSTLSAPPSTNPASESSLLTSAILCPWNAFQLITGSLDGRILVWDFLDATLLQTVDVAQPIHHICAHDKFRNNVFVAVTKPNSKNSDDGVVLQVSLNSGVDHNSASTKSQVIAVIGKIRFPTGLGFSSAGTWLVATAGHKVYVASSSSLRSGFVKYVSPEHLTCLAFHPFEDYFATGDQKGVVRLWYCLNESLAAANAGWVEKHTQTTSFHWHSHAVSSIAFTPNGAYILSGGEEAVLVIWQLPSGKREFVPRLGAPINAIGVARLSGQESFLVGLADATYSFINLGSLRVSRSYSGIKLDPTPSLGLSTSQKNLPIAVHNATSSTLILPSSHPSSLQIYSPYSSKLLYELEVAPSNRVSRRDEKPLDPPRVEKVVISPSGQWMATVDARTEDETFHGEIYLKIWWWDQKSGFWILNTRIDKPHGLKEVTDLSFSSSSPPFFVTTGEDGKVRLWSHRTVTQKAGQTDEFWATHSTFAFRSEIPNSVSWSFDASLLAISLGPYVGLYDPHISAIRQTIISPEAQTTSTVRFIGKGGRYLAIAGDRDLVVWDLVVQSVQWAHRASMPIQEIIPHPQEDTFVMFHSHPSADGDKTMALTFHAKSHAPLSEQIIPYHFQSIALFSPSNEVFDFVGITTKWAIISFGEQVLRSRAEGTSNSKISAEAASHQRTLFQDIFGASAFERSSLAQPTSQEAFHTAVSTRSRAPVAAFDGPAYQLPLISTMFDTIISDFVRIRPSEPLPDSKAAEADEDVGMEVDVPEVHATGEQKPRQVMQEEMDGLVKLFKLHTVGLKYTTPAANTNGKVNIQQKVIVNGNARHTAPAPAPRKMNGSSTPKPVIKPPSVPPIVPPSPSEAPPLQSKKRKKSLG